MPIHVDLQLATDATELPDENDFQLWAEHALAVDVDQNQNDIELSIRIVDNEESQSLNLAYRGKDKPTNVLSFPAEHPEGWPEELLNELPLGDIIISAPIVAAEAVAQNKDAQAHWAHMVVHGCLHLLGFDHIKDTEAEVMESLEIKILDTLGFQNPYESA